MSQGIGLPKLYEDTEKKIKIENDLKVDTDGKKLYKEDFKFDCHPIATRPQL